MFSKILFLIYSFVCSNYEQFQNDNNNKTNNSPRRGVPERTHNNKQLHTDNQFTSCTTRTFENGTHRYVTQTRLTHTSVSPGENSRTHTDHPEYDDPSQSRILMVNTNSATPQHSSLDNGGGGKEREQYQVGARSHRRGKVGFPGAGRSTRDTLIHRRQQSVWQHRLCSFLQPAVAIATAHLCTPPG